MILSSDTETTGLNIIHGDKPFIVGTFGEDQRARTWRWDVDPLTRQPSIPEIDLDEIAHEYEHNDIVFHNCDFDLRVLASIGLFLQFSSPISLSFPPGRLRPKSKIRIVKCGALHDTQLLSHAANSTGYHGSHRLKDLALYYLGYPVDDEQILHSATIAARRIGKNLGWKLGTNLKGEAAVASDYWMPRAAFDYYLNDELLFEEMADEDPMLQWKDLATKYNVKDCERTLSLFFFLHEMAETEGLLGNYEKEIRLTPVTYRMEDWGMHISKPQLKSELERFELQAAQYKSRAELLLKVHTGFDVNINSGQQLVEAIEHFGFPSGKTTAKGNVCTDAIALRDLAQYCESHLILPHADPIGRVLRCIVGFDEEMGDDETKPAYRTYVSAVRYLKGYSKLLLGSRVHPSFNPTGTKFTRYSSSEPNGQNVSKKAVIPLRKVYSPPPGHIWLDPDYSQLELRIFAYASGDERMIAAFELGYDFHHFVAQNMYQTQDPTPEQRRYAKAINFKAIYGGINNVPSAYAAQFPSAAQFMASVVNQVHRCGYICTLGGRRIYIDPEKAYVGVDAICQGTAGEIVKNAMAACHELGLVDWVKSAIIANIHDEIIFEIPVSYPYMAIARRIKQVMEYSGQELGVVTPVDLAIIPVGGDWSAPKKLLAGVAV